MVHYRRNRLSGGTYFFTVTLADRQNTFLVDHIDLLREAFHAVGSAIPFETKAIVILPDHLHAIWTLPEDDSDYPARWRAIKSRFTRTVKARGVPLRKTTNGEYDLWQRRYWEHTIRNDADMQQHVNYIHHNPVKHGLVERVSEWPYSSFHRYVRRGMLNQNWGAGEDDALAGEFGE